jgi:isoleucyl-tRNA synthetase
MACASYLFSRQQLLLGQKARFVPGWDTHGLPIELKVLQTLPGTSTKCLGISVHLQVYVCVCVCVCARASVRMYVFMPERA